LATAAGALGPATEPAVRGWVITGRSCPAMSFSEGAPSTACSSTAAGGSTSFTLIFCTCFATVTLMVASASSRPA
jgi:hypothetical protein